MDKLKSRKFILSIVAGLLIVANDGLDMGLDPATITNFVTLIIGYVFGQGAVDVAAHFKKTP